MNDKIFTLNDGSSYYVLETMYHNKQIYMLCSSINDEQSDLKNDLIVLKITGELSDLSVQRITNDEERVEVTNTIMSRINKDL